MATKVVPHEVVPHAESGGEGGPLTPRAAALALPPLIPNSLPFQFSLEVSGGLLGSVNEPRFASNDSRAPLIASMQAALEKGWVNARQLQEDAWVQSVENSMVKTGRDDTLLCRKVKQSFKTYGGDLERFVEAIKLRGAATPAGKLAHQDRVAQLDNCIKVLGFEMDEGQEVPPEVFEDLISFPHVWMKVDLSGDPFLEDCGFRGASATAPIFRVFLNAYERHIQDPDETERVKLTREIRLARIASYESALLFRMKPYDKCKLPPPPDKEDVARYFPVDSAVLAASCLHQKLLEARAVLGWLFWEVFDTLFPKSEADSITPLLQTMPLSMSMPDKIKRRLCNCANRKEALAVLWTVSMPEPFQITFFEEVAAVGGEPSNLLAMVQKAVCQAGMRLRDVGGVMPEAWQHSMHSTAHEHWPLLVKKLSGHEGDDGQFLTKVMPLVEVSAELAYIDFEAYLPTHESSSESEHVWATLFLDLSRWETEQVLSVFNINANDAWVVDELIGVVAQLDECVSALPRPLTQSTAKLELKVRQLAYGFRALQRAAIKQELRDVGMSVLEVWRNSEEDQDGKSLSKLWMARQELRALLRSWCCCCSRWDGARWLEDKLKKNSPAYCKQRVMLLSAPPGVYEERAEKRGLIAKLLPNMKSSKQEKLYPGGFVKKQFLRGGPTQDFWVQTAQDPYPYEPYFEAPQPATDPQNIFLPSEKKHFLKGLLGDGPSDVRFPDGTIDPRQGGADTDPRELIAEKIIDDFLNLSSADESHLMDKLVTPWRLFGRCWFFSPRVLLISSRHIRLHFGPQVASYFEFATHLIRNIVPLAMLGLFVWIAELVGLGVDQHNSWTYIPPIFSLLCPIWSMLVCTTWRRHCEWLAYSWENGLIKGGSEITKAKNDEEKTVRPEFGHRFRKRLNKLSAGNRAARFQQLRGFLGLQKKDMLEGELKDSWNDKVMAQDLERYNTACYIGYWERRRRNSVAILTSAAFIILACAVTAGSMYIQDILEHTGSSLDGLGENATISDYLSSSTTISYAVSGAASGVIVPVLNQVHRIVAEKTTDYQELRHDNQHIAALFQKLFIFQFFNTFNSLFYVAFVRQNLNQLRVHLLLLAASNFAVTNAWTLILGMLQHHFARLRQLACGELLMTDIKGSRIGGLFGHKLVDKDLVENGGAIGQALAMIDHQISCDANYVFSTIDERIEVGVIFSMLAMFAGVMPLLPLVLLGGMLIELRVDAYKLLRLQKFANVHMLVGVGRMFPFLVFLSYFGLIINCLIIVVTKSEGGIGKTGLDELFPNLGGRDKLLVAVLVEHVALAIMLAIQMQNGHLYKLHLEKYRQRYFENRETSVYNQDEPDAGHVYSMRKRLQRKAQTAIEERTRELTDHVRDSKQLLKYAGAFQS
eukprot:TRINITY_DN36565_c0_g1_i1.p1 TRINITY_DN36565_c0_g1~~TRINITY_DN36565_c0_g1_i1.p1  ORF type:complete len:1389 (-),score=231.30 TRINITY_DN36565_c0_g1_i1:7-4173(-)